MEFNLPVGSNPSCQNKPKVGLKESSEGFFDSFRGGQNKPKVGLKVARICSPCREATSQNKPKVGLKEDELAYRCVGTACESE